jgi:glycosyltransferase involved in cell wall biosynthesis
LKLLIIDPNVSISSPSMRGVVLALPFLVERGWSIEVWCWWCDEGLPLDCIVKLPCFGNVPVLALHAFGWWARRRQRLHGRTADVVLTLAPYEPHCDVCLVQFSPFDWERRQRMLGIHSLRDVYERLVNALGLVIARRFFRRTTARTVLSVSEAVAQDLREENPALDISILPNCYDPRRFHPGVRDQFRAEMRGQLGYDDSHRVFVFVSTGHYRRKGFFLAVEALQRLRTTHPEARLLVVGGRPARLAALQAELGLTHDWITFTGMVTEVERYFAASDAFLFPSYSEAFALVEVEAAACGLPLFLTPHHGSEMILEDRVNGRQIPFDAAQIADVLAEFLEGRWLPQNASLKHAIDSETYAARLADILLRVAV